MYAVFQSMRPMIRSVVAGVASDGAPPEAPLTQTEIRTFNRRLVVDENGDPVLDGGGEQVWYDQVNSLYWSGQSLITASQITSIAYHTYYQLADESIIEGETVEQDFDPVQLDAYDADYVSGGIYWAGLLRVDVPKAAFAGRPYKISVVLDGVELTPKLIEWEIVQ